MTRPRYPREFLARLKAVTNKRPRTVIQHILKHGHITTEELEAQYGYRHAPRAVRDVREQGIPLETFRVKDSSGRRIAAYRFADPAKVRADRLGGRRVISKEFKNTLIEKQGCRCSMCLEQYEDRYLQVDHRVPYEVAGDVAGSRRNPREYMLLCGSCNRAKSWSCEHCTNGLESKATGVCKTCYWAHPESYRHIALRRIRRLDLVWAGREVKDHDRLQHRAKAREQTMPAYVKAVLRKHLENGQRQQQVDLEKKRETKDQR